MNTEFINIQPLRYWVQRVLPLVYDDSLSYMELLNKVVYKLNELIENNKLLPDYIADLIKEYISSGAIEKVMAEILADYMLNVKFPPEGLTPATGDGSADDTEAIQGCINYAHEHGGMAVYFPSGSYLTQSLTILDKATMFGYDRYNTRLVLKGGATQPLLTGACTELTLTGLGFDGNMDIQVNNINLIDISVVSGIITNCLLTDGYELLKINVSKDLQINNIIFDHAVVRALNISGEGIVEAGALVFNSLSTLRGSEYILLDSSNGVLNDMHFVGVSPTGIQINGDNNIVKFFKGQVTNPYVDNGINNSIEVYTESKIDKVKGNVTVGVGGDYSETVLKNKIEKVNETKELRANDLIVNTSNNLSLDIINDLQIDSKHYINNSLNYMNTSNNFEFTSTDGTIMSDELWLNIKNNIKYSIPTEYDTLFKSIKFKDINNNNYDVLVAKLKDYSRGLITLTEMGAIGDGSTDNTQAFNSFINKLYEGYIGFIPAGNFYISTPITINSSCQIFGQGRKSNLIFETNGLIIDTGTNNSGVNLDSFTISAKSEKTSIGLQLKGYYHKINNLFFMGLNSDLYDPTYSWLTAIQFNTLWYTVISNCTFLNAPLHTTTDFYFNGVALKATDQSVNNIITHCTFNNFETVAIWGEQTEAIVMDTNLTVNCATAINDRGYQNNIINNLFDMEYKYGLILNGRGTIVTNNFVALHYYSPYKDKENFIPVSSIGTAITLSNNYFNGGSVQPINGLILQGDFYRVSNNYINAFRTAINMTGDNNIITGNSCVYAGNYDIVVSGNFNQIFNNTLSNEKLAITGNNNSSQYDYLTYANIFNVSAGDSFKTNFIFTKMGSLPSLVLFCPLSPNIYCVYEKDESDAGQITFTIYPIAGSLTSGNVTIAMLIIR